MCLWFAKGSRKQVFSVDSGPTDMFHSRGFHRECPDMFKYILIMFSACCLYPACFRARWRLCQKKLMFTILVCHCFPSFLLLFSNLKLFVFWWFILLDHYSFFFLSIPFIFKGAACNRLWFYVWPAKLLLPIGDVRTLLLPNKAPQVRDI